MDSKTKEITRDKIRGCLFGGAVGDALGYPVEFFTEGMIKAEYGNCGIQTYARDKDKNKALISDDTQMALFTAAGILTCETTWTAGGMSSLTEIHCLVADSYIDWLRTQNMNFAEAAEDIAQNRTSWLAKVPELYAGRAPGMTCITALHSRLENDSCHCCSFIGRPINSSKGCGGIMRVAPLGTRPYKPIEKLDYEGAELAAITHSHSLGYMTAAVLVHIINRIIYPKGRQTLKAIVEEARDTVACMFGADEHTHDMVRIINQAMMLAEGCGSDIDNIHSIGEGWVAEETLGIAIYCCLKYEGSFSKGVAAAVNHCGDSDSTGAVAGNILGALCGYSAIEDKWKNGLELSEVILEIADDLSVGGNSRAGAGWMEKYVRHTS